jgi:hypothetical protein
MHKEMIDLDPLTSNDGVKLSIFSKYQIQV